MCVPARKLDEITQLVVQLLNATHSITSLFSSRWQVIRTKLATLKSILTEISESPNWSYNVLLQTRLPDLVSALHRTQTLCAHCSDPSITPGKLLMQSDLDMVSAWLSRQIYDLDLLLRSGVLHHSTAIVLSRPAPKEDLSLYIRDLFTRIQIGGQDFKREALESLVQLMDDDDNLAGSVAIAKEENMGCLVELLDDFNAPECVRELAVQAVSMLVSMSDFARKCVFEVGALGPLLRLMDYSSMPIKEKAGLAVEFITSDPDHTWAMSAYGGIPILVRLCQSGSTTAQSCAVGAIRNVCTVEDARIALEEDCGIPVLLQLLVSGSPETQEKAADCISILASSGENMCRLLLRENCLQILLQLIKKSLATNTLEHLLHAIYSLSACDSAYQILSGSTTFITRIADLMKHGNIMLRHTSASLLANLSVSDDDKRRICCCMSTLVKLMESMKPDGLQEVGASALVSLLSVTSNRKEFVRDEKCLIKLVQLLDPKNNVIPKRLPVTVVVALLAGGSRSVRKGLMAAGVSVHLQKLVEMDVAGAKKALHRLLGNRLASILSRSWREW